MGSHGWTIDTLAEWRYIRRNVSENMHGIATHIITMGPWPGMAFRKRSYGFTTLLDMCCIGFASRSYLTVGTRGKVTFS
jgi:hypothetical protein